MRNFVIVALTLLGTGLMVSDANAQRWAHRGSNSYIYPRGTTAYFVGPQGRSNTYIIPTVSNGNISQWYNNTPNYFPTQSTGNYNNFNGYSAPTYSGQNYIRPFYYNR